MIIMGNSFNIPDYMTDLDVYNFTSMNERYTSAPLVPNGLPDMMSERDFDLWYANWIMSTEQAFFALVTIMYSIYYGRSVYLIIGEYNPYIDNLNQSLAKFIQERYGYVVSMINDIEDIIYIDQSQLHFSLNGIYNFDMDKDQYCYATAAQNLDIEGIINGGV